MDSPVAFTCNLCGAHNQVARFATEPPSCACGSNVRLRALIHLLSLELFGRSLVLRDFPVIQSIRGLGMTDHAGYAALLAEKFDYTNTYYDRPPRFDFTAVHEAEYGAYDFILSAHVLEHIAPPAERALDEICKLLKPAGFLAATVPCTHDDSMREHFPGLHEYRVVQLGESQVLINRKADGTLEIRDGLAFHEGPGAVLEMRQFGATGLRGKLLAAGFREVEYLTSDWPAAGILFDDDVSQPLIARKERFRLGETAQQQLLDSWEAAMRRVHGAELEAGAAAERARMAGESRWVRLGRLFGVGPKL